MTYRLQLITYGLISTTFKTNSKTAPVFAIYINGTDRSCKISSVSKSIIKRSYMGTNLPLKKPTLRLAFCSNLLQ